MTLETSRNYEMCAGYSSPCAIITTTLRLVAEIGEAIGRLSLLAEGNADSLRLRRKNRIRTVQGALAIEGNTLSESQITAMLEGRRVLAPLREIMEARNALGGYAPCTEQGTKAKQGVAPQKTPVKTSVKIVELLQANPYLTLSEVATQIGKSLSAVERASAKLVKDGLLRYVGPQKGGHWEIIKHA